MKELSNRRQVHCRTIEFEPNDRIWRFPVFRRNFDFDSLILICQMDRDTRK